MKRALLGAGLAAIFMTAAGCVTTNHANVADFQHHVRAGMSESQVIEVLGQPSRVTIPWRPKLQGWMKVVEFELNYGNYEPGCPENEIGKALLGFVTLGLSEAVQKAENRHRYRLYFHQGRFVAGCRVAKRQPVGRFCHKLESDLIRLGYAGWSRPRFAAQPRPVEPAARQRREWSGFSASPAGKSPRLQTGAWPASAYRPSQGKQLDPAPDSRFGRSVPPPPPGSIRPRW